MNPLFVVVSSMQSVSPEMALARRMLRRALPRNAHWLDCGNRSAAEAVQAISAPEESGLLLLAHDCLLPAPGTLDLLGESLRNADFADACDHIDPSPMPPPGYSTARGMERYAAASPPKTLAVSSDSPCLFRLTTLGGWAKISRGVARGVRVSPAFVHDFIGYRGSERKEVLPLLPAGPRRILDVGGGEGGFLSAAKALSGSEAHLVEIDVTAAGKAAGKVDRVWQGDFLSLDIPFEFDSVSFLDMLEHVANPEDYLRRAARLLAPGGSIIASIPNVGHWSVIADLIEGRWDYAPAGIHCITHLRFFTRRTIEDLFEDAGLFIELIEPVFQPCPPEWKNRWSGTESLLADSSGMDTCAYLVRARPK